MSRNRPARLAALVAILFATAACGGDDDEATRDAAPPEGSVLRVPEDLDTIQAAVDAAEPGDLVLIDAGTYHEAVDVTTPDITIRGMDRNEVILDGEFELENGIRVLDTDGVVVENMTARNYLSNGFFWTGSDRYRGSYLTAYRNGDYGIYAFDAYHGQLDHSYASGSPDAGFYIGECYRCDAVIDQVVSEHNGLGYSGTNSGGDLYIVRSTFRNNRAGIVPNSGSYELCYPGRENTIVGNIVHSNNYLDGPGIDVSLLAQGNGILVAGSIDNVIERNLVFDHDRTGIGMVPFPEEDANDVAPPEAELDVPCEETRDDEPPAEAPGLVLWNASGNRVVGNVVSDSRLADLASATLEDPAKGITTESLDNCFSDNTFATSAPANIEELSPCDGDGSGGDFSVGALDLVTLVASQPPAPPKDAWKITPAPPAQETMPDPEGTPAERFDGPEVPDVDAVEVPVRPSGT